MRLRRFVALTCAGILVAGCTPGIEISWEPESLRVTVEPNSYRVYVVTLHARSTIDELDLPVTTTFRPLVSMVPSTLRGVAAGSSRGIRFAFLLPATAQPGQPIMDDLVPGLPATLDVAWPTAEGTLESIRLALEYGNDTAYLAQFAPSLVAEQRQTLAGFTDTARQALAQTLRTAERAGSSGETVEYRVTLLLRGQRVESSIVLRRGADGIWRVVRF